MSKRARAAERPLMEWLAIASALRGLWDAHTPGKELETVTRGLELLKESNVTIEELLALAQTAGPLIDLLQRR